MVFKVSDSLAPYEQTPCLMLNWISFNMEANSDNVTSDAKARLVRFWMARNHRERERHQTGLKQEMISVLLTTQLMAAQKV